MLLIIKNGEIMIITKQNPNGGPTLKSYPIREDKETGVLGYHVGYCPCGCNEPLLIRTVDIREVVNRFGMTLNEHDQVFQRLEPKKPLRQKIIEFLGGKA
jgi:hypothetical protein